MNVNNATHRSASMAAHLGDRERHLVEITEVQHGKQAGLRRRSVNKGSEETAVIKVTILSQWLVTMMLWGILTQVASFSYHAVQETANAAANPIAIHFSRSHSEAARFVLIHSIAEQYGITVADRTADWQLDEVSSLKRSLDQIAQRLSDLTGRDGQQFINYLFSGIALYRDHSWQGNIAYTIGGTVSVYDAWARFDETGRTFYLAHELGHVLDAKDMPLHLFMGEDSQTFARNVDAGTDKNGIYHLGRTYPLRDPRDQPRHRADNAAEDWAESFATVIVPAFEAELRDIGQAREQEVRRFIRLWAIQAFRDDKLQ